MPDIILILSDLHLANGQSILDGFGDIQQSAFEGLTNAACGAGPMGHADEVELVINGDCFDFLVTAPYDTGGVSDVSTSLEKLQKIITAHPSFFEALRSFIETPGRHVTFMTGHLYRARESLRFLESCYPRPLERGRGTVGSQSKQHCFTCWLILLPTRGPSYQYQICLLRSF